MQVNMTVDQAMIVVEVLAQRVRQIDDTECYNEPVIQQMAAERAMLVAVIGEIGVAKV